MIRSCLKDASLRLSVLLGDKTAQISSQSCRRSSSDRHQRALRERECDLAVTLRSHVREVLYVPFLPFTPPYPRPADTQVSPVGSESVAPSPHRCLSTQVSGLDPGAQAQRAAHSPPSRDLALQSSRPLVAALTGFYPP